ncbi:MAG: PASTA domain-containing protein [Bacteroidales bacterium]
MATFNDLIRSRSLWINIGLMVALTFILFWIGFRFLNIYTRHGSNFVVPDFTGMTPEAIMQNDDFSKFKIIVFDSIYDNSRQGGIVIDQDPEGGTEVKKKRTIHLTVVSKLQEMVSLPDLGNTARSARSQLEAYGLVLGKTTEVPSEYSGLLLGATYMGKPVDEGDKIPKGSRIDIEVGISRSSFPEDEEGEESDLLNEF